MRVAVLDPSLFTFPYDHSLCEALARRGWEVVLVGCPRPTSTMIPGPASGYERWAYFYRWTHGPWGRRPEPLRLALKGLEHVVGMVRLVRRLRAWRPDVIHFQWLPLPVIDRWFLPRLRRLAPLVLTVHDTEPFQGSPSSPLQLWGFLDALRHFDGWIVHTEFSRWELVRRTGLPEDRVFVVPHGALDYYRRLWDTARRETAGNGPPDALRILFFGLIKPYKGLDLLVEALARLPDDLRRTVRLDVIGLPRMDVRPIQARARALGVGENIRWDLRFVPEAEIPGIFESATVVALPYRRVDQSSVLMAAVAFGKPVVATRVGGFAEVIRDGIHGLLVDPGDPDGLARALTTLLTDAGLRRRMTEAIRTLAAGDLSWDAVAERTLGVYGEIRRRDRKTIRQ